MMYGREVDIKGDSYSHLLEKCYNNVIELTSGDSEKWNLLEFKKRHYKNQYTAILIKNATTSYLPSKFDSADINYFPCEVLWFRVI